MAFYSSTDTQQAAHSSGCLSPFRYTYRDNQDITSLSWGGYSAVHPEALKLGAEVIGFMQDFYSNFSTLYPWMEDTRINLLEGACKAAMPTSGYSSVTAREMHIAVMIPRWLGEGYRSNGLINGNYPYMAKHYKFYRSRGINPLIAWAMSYMSCQTPRLTYLGTPGDQSPFNYVSSNDIANMADRLIEINSMSDTSIDYSEGYAFWSEIPPAHPRIEFTTPQTVEDMVQNALNLQEAMDTWRAAA